MRNTNEKKNTKTKGTKKTSSRRKKETPKIHFFSIMIAIILVSLVCLGVMNITKVLVKDKEAKSNLQILSLFDNEVTNQSTYLYAENDGTNKFILHTALKKENKNKRVYDLKIYKEKTNEQGEIVENLELVVDKNQIKIGPTVIYKSGLEPEETFTTKFVNAKDQKAEVNVIRETDLELVVELKYTNKEDKVVTEKITMEKTRGIVRIEKTSNERSMPKELNLVKTYFKLPEGIKWNQLFEDYMSE